ncbi:MAG: hypothetical protein U0263_02340 [Polyangiaceae bacterium]
MVNARPWFARFVAIALLSTPGLALAQGNVSVAEGLFREGRELMEKGDYPAACAKLAESQRLDPSAGTLLNLASCQEKQGRIASAWANYLAAARLARTQNRNNIADEAKQRAGELEPKVSYLKIVLAERVQGIQVKIDDVTLESAALDSKIPVDPGERNVSISAPGHRTASMKVSIGAEHDSQTLNVPKLEKDDAAPGPKGPGPEGPVVTPNPTPDTPVAPADPPVLGYVVGGVGVVALGVGTAFAFMAKSAYGDAEDKCPSKTSCSSDAMDLRDKAETRANIANVGIGLGLVGVGVGAVLILTHSPSKPEKPPSTGFRSLRLSPFASSSSAGLALSGVTF